MFLLIQQLSEILVPAPEYYEAKMKLAAERSSNSVPQGYDLAEKIPMGTSIC